MDVGGVHRKYFYGKTRKEVADKVAELTQQLKGNTYIEPSKVTLYEWLCEWLTVYCKSELRMTTYVNFETYVHRHIKESIGGYKLSKLTTATFQQFYNGKSKKGRLDGSGGLSHKTLRNMHNMLYKALNQAVCLNMIAKNPVDHITLPKRSKPEMRFFTVEEQQRLIREGYFDYIITIDTYDWDNYELIATSEDRCVDFTKEEFYYRYNLYQRTDANA